MDKSSTKRYLRQGSSLDLKNVVQMDMKNESRVLVLYTGGTIGKGPSINYVVTKSVIFDPLLPTKKPFKTSHRLILPLISLT